MKKIKVNQQKIKTLLKEGKSCYAISNALHLPWTVISRIKSGKNVEYYSPKPRKDKGCGSSKNKLCTHCGLVPPMPGNTFLCRLCYKSAGCGDIYPDCEIHLPNF